MNQDMDKKLDRLLNEMPKPSYDVDAWLVEDETEAFDRIMRQQQKKTVRRWMATAASLLLILGIGATMFFKNQQPKPEAAVVAKTEKPSTKMEEKPSIKETKMVEAPPVAIAETIKEKRKTQIDNSPKDNSNIPPQTLPSEENEMVPNQHYALLKTKTDTVPYQDPARVDEFITKFANYYNVKQGELQCSIPRDSNVVSAVYVFPDKKDVDVFGRLLQAARWYSDKTPGYLLEFSHHQFFFELKDMRRQLQYRWIAERINGNILLYSICAPIGAKESSACYHEYCEELMNND